MSSTQTLPFWSYGSMSGSITMMWVSGTDRDERILMPVWLCLDKILWFKIKQKFNSMTQSYWTFKKKSYAFDVVRDFLLLFTKNFTWTDFTLSWMKFRCLGLMLLIKNLKKISWFSCGWRKFKLVWRVFRFILEFWKYSLWLWYVMPYQVAKVSKIFQLIIPIKWKETH